MLADEQCTAIEDVHRLTTEHQPDIVVSASTWDQGEADRITQEAKAAYSAVKRVAVPSGQHDREGGSRVTDYVAQQVRLAIAELESGQK